MHVLILGPTGTAGAAVLNKALANTQIDKVTILHRRKVGMQHPKLHEIIHTDFVNYTGLEHTFASIDICFFCLGISQLKEKNRERFFQITHDFPVTLAKALFYSNRSVTFCFLSGQGADPSGKSKIAFAQAKGAAENSLTNLGLNHLYIFRPGYIHTDRPHANRTPGERISGFLYPVLKTLLPSFVIHADELAKGMINVALKGYPIRLLDNEMIKEYSE